MLNGTMGRFSRSVSIFLADEYGVLSVHEFIGDVGDDVGNQSQTQMLVVLGAYVLVSHFARLDGVERPAGIFQGDEHTLVADMQMHVERLCGDTALGVLGDVGHQLFAADVDIEGGCLVNVAVFEELVNVGECCVDIIEVVLHGAIVGVSFCGLRNHGQWRDGGVMSVTAERGIAQLEEQHHDAASEESPPEFYSLYFCHCPHAYYQHDGLGCSCEDAGFVVA